jgi:hypothetical protein
MEWIQSLSGKEKERRSRIALCERAASRFIQDLHKELTGVLDEYIIEMPEDKNAVTIAHRAELAQITISAVIPHRLPVTATVGLNCSRSELVCRYSSKHPLTQANLAQGWSWNQPLEVNAGKLRLHGWDDQRTFEKLTEKVLRPLLFEEVRAIDTLGDG